MLRHFRTRIFYKLLAVVSPRTRSKRMELFVSALNLKPGMRLIDLGGAPEFWDDLKPALNITVVNLPGVSKTLTPKSHHTIEMVEGDATDLGQYQDNSFDIAFSNSVIEHVGGPDYEARFARETRRLAAAYWVQTPSIWFPLEAHSGIPLWFLLPAFVRRAFHRRWEQKLPAWNEMIAGTVVISKKDFQAYFPDATLRTERVFGIPKSYYAFRTVDR
jgi:hypothetical protein